MNRASSATGWVRNPDGTLGWTWNPITGCLNGCEYCYARKLANTRLKERYLANNNLAPLIGEGIVPYHTTRMLDAIDPFYPRFWEDRLFQPFNDKHISQKGIFVCDMSDLFGIGIPEKWTKAVMDVMEDCPTDRFYLLTKQYQNLPQWSPFPDNCWVGVTVTNWIMLPDALYNLSKIEAQIKYISFEPLLEFVPIDGLNLVKHGINWVIIGAQTKPYKPPKWEWVSEIIDACVDAGIPYFLKNNLEPIVPKVFGGEGELRQEMPE